MGRYTKGRRYSWEPGYRKTRWEKPSPQQPMTEGLAIFSGLLFGLIGLQWNATYWPSIVLLVMVGFILALRSYLMVATWIDRIKDRG